MTDTRRRVKIAVDAMGGDYAPGEIVRGAVAAAEQGNVEPVLVGPLDILEGELAKYNTSNLPISCVNADTYIKEEGNPALAVRRNPNSSIAVAARMVREGEVDGLLGATATGALITSAIQYIGMIEGITRPVIGGVLSGLAPRTAVFDLGVNLECRPHHLLTFAYIGTVYARIFLDIPDPTVGLLNVGKEDGKGTGVVREAYELLKESGLNFVGNVEGNVVLSGNVNVIVCDAFVGNAIMKLCEGAVGAMGGFFKSKSKSYPLIGRFLKNKVKGLLNSLVLTDSAGGGLIWGVDGVVLKIHGHSTADEVTRKIGQAGLAVRKGMVDCLKTELREMIKIPTKI
jgi:glycerol-3-phosphate acyltransferase PlsX